MCLHNKNLKRCVKHSTVKRCLCFVLICLSGLFFTTNNVEAIFYTNIVFLGSCESIKKDLCKACFLEGQDDILFNSNGLVELEKPVMYKGKNITLIFRQSIEEWAYNPVLCGQNIVIITLDSEKIVEQNFDVEAVKEEVDYWLEKAYELDYTCKVILVGANCNSINRYHKNLVLKTLNHIASMLMLPKRVILTTIGSVNSNDSCNRLLSEIGNKIRICLSHVDFSSFLNRNMYSGIYICNDVYQQLYSVY